MKKTSASSIAVAGSVYLATASMAFAQCMVVATTDGTTVYDITFRTPDRTRVVTTGEFDGTNQGWFTTTDGFPIVRVDTVAAGDVTISAGGNQQTYSFPGPGMYAVVFPYPAAPGNTVFTVASGPAPVSGGTATFNAASPFVSDLIAGTPIGGTPACGAITNGEDFARIARMSQDLAAHEVGTFHERWQRNSMQDGQFFAWSRLFGNTSSGDDSWDVSNGGAQFGLGYIIDGDAFQTRLSAFVSFSRASGDFPSLSADIDHNGGGVMAALIAPDAYLDLVAKWSDVDADVSNGVDRDEVDGSIWTVSAEAGYAFDVAPGTIIEPQAQIIYSDLDLDTFGLATDGSTFRTAELRDGDSLRGRLGLRVAHDLEAGGETDWSVWGRADIWHEFSGNTAFAITDSFIGDPSVSSSAVVDENGDDTWVDLTAGVQGAMTNGVSVNGSVRARVLDGDTQFGGSAAVKLRF